MDYSSIVTATFPKPNEEQYERIPLPAKNEEEKVLSG
jgi:hypothetical protein